MAREGESSRSRGSRGESKRHKRPRSPEPIMSSHRGKVDLHHGIETFVKGTLLGDKDAKEDGEKEKKDRHKAWAEKDKGREKKILGAKEGKKSNKIVYDPKKGSGAAIAFIGWIAAESGISIHKKKSKRKHRSRSKDILDEEYSDNESGRSEFSNAVSRRSAND
ncbi:hypothetical protein G7Z17_g11332 [Cylindrodendrum hubeiense]|uniref:Uncharacterized protein n=1 Tax=Cylindrodendrum hubeiense TaxID=595255 RepID=A0A9P5H330_9HYPO|nr:hypothetical protein G7Z17_g11332 [Cylindrodendrum hubeiense]